jgi:acetyl esterase
VENRFNLSPEMLAFAEYLRRGDDLVDGQGISALRKGTKQLRVSTNRQSPQLHAVDEEAFEGQRVRIYRPNPLKDLPTLVFFHGGAWSHLDVDVYDPILRQLAIDGPATVVGIDYPLVPETPFPGNLASCVRFLTFVHGSGEFAGQSIGVMGDSAGANLAIGSVLELKSLGREFVNAMGLIYGAFDLSRETPSYERYGGGDLPMTTKGVRSSQALYVPNPRDRTNPLVSPLLADLRGLPRTFLSVASHDNLYNENLEMARQLGYAGVDVNLRIYAGAIHGFLEAWSVTGSEVARTAIRDIAQFMAHAGKRQVAASRTGSMKSSSRT